MLDWSLEPARTAVINVDMQRCFVADTPIAAPGGPMLLPKINELVRRFRSAGALIVHTRGVLKADGSDTGVVAKLLPPFIRGLYTEGAATMELHDDLDVAAEDVIIDKPRYGAFHGTALDVLLRSRGVDTLVICGIATNICCETTAREASQHDYRVVFLSDGTATSDMNGVPAASLQRATLASLGQVFARIATIEDVVAAIAA